MITWYFAYGSNMNPARMRARGLDFEQRCAGVLPGFQMRFNKAAAGKSGVAYANIVYQPQLQVEGVLYKLNDHSAISLMDHYEGSPVRYSREVFSIGTGRDFVDAWVYIANPKMLDEQLLPERRYLQHLLSAEDLLSEPYYRWLENQPCLENDDELCFEKGLRVNA